MKKLIIPILAILSVPLLIQSVPTEVLKLKTFDALITTPPPSGNFVVLNISEDDVEREGGYPFPRQRLAEIHNELLAKGATGVGWVISFPQPDRLGGDAEFAEALSQGGSVIAMFEDNKGIYPPPIGTVIKGSDIGGIVSSGTKQNIESLAVSALQGVAVAPVEVDLLIRRIPLVLRIPDGWVASFGTQVLKALTGANTYIITANENGIQEVAVRGIPPVKTDSDGRKWVSWIVPHGTSLQEMDVFGRYVFVGVTAAGVMPQVATPVGLLNPHHIQAALAESMLVQNSPHIPDYALAVEVALFSVSVSLIWLLLHVMGMTGGIALVGAVMASTGCLGVYLVQQGLLIDVTWALVSQFITASIGFYLRFREQYKARQLIKQQFGKYLDPRMVKKLQDNPELCQVNGARVDCSIIFTDLRGFTSLSESVEPEMVTYIMNNVLDVQVKAVNKYGGVTDKFIGDAGMFHWNTIIPQPDHHNLALAAATEIENNIIELNRQFQEEGIPEIAIGVGVNSGICIAGNFGATDRFAFSLIGDPCNIAARLESATKEVGVGTLIGEETAINSDYLLKSLDPISVKGKSQPLEVYTWG